MHTIKWRGDKVRNSQSRGDRMPCMIASHISAGTRGSVYNWFTSPNNTNASSHFLVSREGEIDQYVRLELAAWTQGLNPANGDIDYALSPIVHEMGINPNLYCISIEHEGYVEGHLNGAGEVELVNYGLDGDLTEKQFWATCWLHKWIQMEVLRIYDIRIPLNSHNVDGHYRIDPRRKPNCPGPKFPWQRLYAELLIAEGMTLESFEEYIAYKTSDHGISADSYAFLLRFKQLVATMENPKYGNEAKRKIKQLAPIMPQIGLQGPVTIETTIKRIAAVENAAIKDGKWEEEGKRKLNIAAQYAKQVGIL